MTLVRQLLESALLQQRAGNFTEAEQLLRQVLKQNPNEVDALHFLGMLLGQLGRTEEAIELLELAVRIHPKNAMLQNNLGTLYPAVGRLDEAIRCFRKAIQLAPGFAEAHSSLGNALRLQGNMSQSIAACRKALAINPNLIEAHNNLGSALALSGFDIEAILSFQRAIQLNPKYVRAYVNLAASLGTEGRHDEAIGLLQQALAQEPSNIGVLTRLGELFLLKGLLGDAANYFGRALQQAPRDAELLTAFANVLLQLWRPDDAIACLIEADKIAPQSGRTNSLLAAAYMAVGRPETAIGHARKALECSSNDPYGFSSLLLSLQSSSSISSPELFAEHLRFAERFERPLAASLRPHDNIPSVDRKLRVGYVSADLYRHPVAFFVEPMLEHHDKTRFEIFCYYNRAAEDEHTRRIKKLVDHWVPCSQLSDEQLAERIRGDQIDILIDLAGHTSQHRLLTFARKPAPIQMTWIGYPGTTGLSAMDYRLTDTNMDPIGLTEKMHTERLLRLPGMNVAFRHEPDAPQVNVLPALSTGIFTFASLNSPAKTNELAIRLWARILHATPASRLFLGNISSVTLRQYLTDQFAKEGIPAERLNMLPRMPLKEYLSLHGQIDLSLDPFPYTGGTTTTYSLWMGVPVITLAGDRTVSRIGATLLKHAGLDEFVTYDEDSYVERAVAFAGDLPRLNHIRLGLRQQMMANPGNDPVTVTRHLEDAFRAVWREWCGRQAGGQATSPDESDARPKSTPLA